MCYEVTVNKYVFSNSNPKSQLFTLNNMFHSHYLLDKGCFEAVQWKL